MFAFRAAFKSCECIDTSKTALRSSRMRRSVDSLVGKMIFYARNDKW